MSYFPATLVSVIAHGVLIVLVFKGWDYTQPPEPPKPPPYIKATLLDLKTQGKQGAPKPKPKPKPETKAVLDKLEVEKQRLEKKRSQQKAKQKQVALEKAKKEKAQKLKQEKAKKEKAQKLKQEEEKKKLAEARKKKQQDQMRSDQKKLKDELTKERERLEAELQAEALAQQVDDDQRLSQSYILLIQQRIQQNWSRPPSARNDMEADLTIQMVPTGEIIDVLVKKSSGNGAYDRSAIQAVKKTRQVPELRQVPSRIFEQQFRKFTLTFKPQDLRQ